MKFFMHFSLIDATKRYEDAEKEKDSAERRIALLQNDLDVAPHKHEENLAKLQDLEEGTKDLEERRNQLEENETVRWRSNLYPSSSPGTCWNWVPRTKIVGQIP